MPPDPGDDAAYLADMLRYAREIAARVERVGLAEFLANDDLRLATERRIEIIGEAARGVSTACRDANPQVPWRAIIAQRHILAHEYGDVVPEKIWRVASVHIPALIEVIAPLVPPTPDQG
ncbi:MAG: HepT-like ribonuclease domain-containing protein [Planctomycetota bacterium]